MERIFKGDKYMIDVLLVVLAAVFGVLYGIASTASYMGEFYSG